MTSGSVRRNPLLPPSRESPLLVVARSSLRSAQAPGGRPVRYPWSGRGRSTGGFPTFLPTGERRSSSMRRRPDKAPAAVQGQRRGSELSGKSSPLATSGQDLDRAGTHGKWSCQKRQLGRTRVRIGSDCDLPGPGGTNFRLPLAALHCSSGDATRSKRARQATRTHSPSSRGGPARPAHSEVEVDVPIKWTCPWAGQAQRKSSRSPVELSWSCDDVVEEVAAASLSA